MTDDASTAAPQDGTFYIQVGSQVFGDLSPQSADEGVVLATTERLRRIGAAIQETSATLITSLDQLTRRPDELEIEFGVSLGGEAGIPFVSKGKAEANFTVKVRWTRANA